MVLQREKKNYIWISLLILVLLCNFLLYRSSLPSLIVPEKAKWIIFGSLFDLAVVLPLLVLAINRKKNFLIRRFIILMAGGIILTRFIIPTEFFKPYVEISYIGFAIEGVVLLLELSLIVTMIRYMPAVIQQIRLSNESLLFSFATAIEEKVNTRPIIQVVTSELLLFYYAFASWRKSLPTGPNYFTLYKNSSLIPLQIMLIHAIILETIGIHWWLHNQSILLSIILLILNVYSIVFFIGDIQALRLNPLKITNDDLYISLGLTKRMVLPLNNIALVTTDKQSLEKKLEKETTIEFIARDLEAVHPHVILELKNPCNATLMMGMKKTYTKVALRLDDPAKFIETLKARMSEKC
ncbi:beta-carotene 15,15'-monooxygenase [Bacillus solimangrovi]|uniref:Beta-carotene 15,15'-monooxygenase n=1 Tax=Bacillus solimangrovi TaxID=1305675 RepID=A0A1E5LEV4_9BACI|nr:beta-carotene 15,15'-monooxygenase [Bacillus solimangrovi]